MVRAPALEIPRDVDGDNAWPSPTNSRGLNHAVSAVLASKYPLAAELAPGISRRSRRGRRRQWVGGNPAGGAAPPTPTASRPVLGHADRGGARSPPLSR